MEASTWLALDDPLPPHDPLSQETTLAYTPQSPVTLLDLTCKRVAGLTVHAFLTHKESHPLRTPQYAYPWPYRGTSLMRKSPLEGPYSRDYAQGPMVVLGGGRGFSWARYPCIHPVLAAGVRHQ